MPPDGCEGLMERAIDSRRIVTPDGWRAGVSFVDKTALPARRDRVMVGSGCGGEERAGK